MEKKAAKDNDAETSENHKEAMRTQEEAEHATGERREELTEKAEDQAEGKHSGHEEGPKEGKGHLPTT